MAEKLEKLIKQVYASWKAGAKEPLTHPGEEELACFIEGKLTTQDTERIREHVIVCGSCSETVALILGQPVKQEEVPQAVLDTITGQGVSVLEIILELKAKVLELLSTTGDVLVGQEYMPCAVLRSRSIKEFKDEVTVLKDFADVRLEARLENRAGKAFDVAIKVRDKSSQKLLKDVRVSLFKDETELESYLADSGSVVFEHVLIGKYKVEVATLEKKVASVFIDVRA
jgi:hypothetical protein